MESEDKNLFEELFSKLSLNINNFKSDSYLNDLIAFLRIKNLQNSREIYKYTIFFLITNREKISYLLNSNERDQKRVEMLTFYMEKFVRNQQCFLSINEMFVSFFPEVFRLRKNRNNSNEILIEKNQLINKLGSHSTNVINDHNIQIENLRINHSDLNNKKSKDSGKEEIYQEKNIHSKIPLFENAENKKCGGLNIFNFMKINSEPIKENRNREISNSNSESLEKKDKSQNVESYDRINNNLYQNRNISHENKSSEYIPRDFNKVFVNSDEKYKDKSSMLNNISPNSNNENPFGKRICPDKFIKNTHDDNNQINKFIQSDMIPRINNNQGNILSNLITENISLSNVVKDTAAINQPLRINSISDRDHDTNTNNRNSVDTNFSNPSSISPSYPAGEYNLTNQEKKSLNKSISKINQILESYNELKSIKLFTQKILNNNNTNNNNNNLIELFPVPEKLEFIEDEKKLKLMTIYSKLVFIFSKSQKSQIKDKFSQIINNNNFTDKKSADIIRNTLFYDANFKAISCSNKPFPADFLLNVYKNIYNKCQVQEYLLSLIKSVTEKEDVVDLFYLFTINKLHEFLNAELQYKILFFLFILICKSQLFSMAEDKNLLKSMYLMKIYNIEIPADNSDDCLLYRNSHENYNEIFYCGNRLDIIGDKCESFENLFSEYDVKFCYEVIKTIKKFYKFQNDIDLVGIIAKDNNFRSTMNIVELVSKKEFYIYQNFSEHKTNMLKLEKFLYSNYKKFNPKMEFNSNIYYNQKKAFIEISNLIDKINENFQTKHKYYNPNQEIKVSLYPFGSVTQFLGAKSSDLDIYMHITGDRRDKLHFLRFLIDEIMYHYRINKNQRNSHTIISNRLITITFSNSDHIKIDLNYFGVCSVLNSTLLRVYSLMDTRFVILAYNLKLITKDLKINNSDDKKNYLNSFCLMMLLVTFLQDIVYPPVLPKILANCQRVVENLEAGNKIKKTNLNKKNNYYKHKKSLEEVYENISNREFDVNYDFQTQYDVIYKKFLDEQPVRNNMSLAELFLKFIEFLIFYFKNDSVFVYCGFSPTGEGFYSKNDLKNFEFDQKFSMVVKNLLKKGDFLIREPFDHTYNPAQTMVRKDTEEFVEKLKNLYFQLIEKGEYFVEPDLLNFN